MNISNPFLQATKQNLRFATSRGFLTTEDLWALSLRDLDSLALHVDAQINAAPKKSFITETVKADSEDVLRLEILKAVIADKIADRDAAKIRADKRARQTFLKDLIEKKKADELGNLSLDDLQKQLAEASAD